MDIKAIEYFVQTFKEQNISKAANTLFISQQGLSKSIRSLETELGVPLFYRTKTGVEPTEYANLILPYAQAIVSNYIQLKNSIDELGNTHTGTIKLGLVNGAISAMPIGEIIFDFISIYPDITTVMLFTPSPVADISSSTVREVLSFGRTVEEFMPIGIDINKYL